MIEELNMEQISMGLIVNSGNARSLCFQALAKAKLGDFEAADRLMEESQKCSLKAHKTQSSVLFAEANGKKNEINVLLIHAQDHLMTSLLAQELIAEMIVLHKDKQDKEVFG